MLQSWLTLTMLQSTKTTGFPRRTDNRQKNYRRQSTPIQAATFSFSTEEPMQLRKNAVNCPGTVGWATWKIRFNGYLVLCTNINPLQDIDLNINTEIMKLLRKQETSCLLVLYICFSRRKEKTRITFKRIEFHENIKLWFIRRQHWEVERQGTALKKIHIIHNFDLDPRI